MFSYSLVIIFCHEVDKIILIRCLLYKTVYCLFIPIHAEDTTTILPVVYGCEKWSLTLREEH